MDDLIASVKSKQREIKDLQTEQAEQKGSKEQVLKQLKHDFDVASLTDAEKVLDEFKKEKDKNEKLLSKLDKEMEKIINSAKSSSSD
jgi:F0F1-type ATP synthase membrane subunit b/b'